MIRAFVVGAVLGLGVWLVLRGLFPARPSLADRLGRLTAARAGAAGPTAVASTIERFAVWLLRIVQSDLLPEMQADIEVTGGRLEAHAMEKLKAAAGGGVIVFVVPLLFGLIESVPFLTMAALVGMIVAYYLPDLELRRKAAARREELIQTLNDFVGLVAVSITGGGGVNSAMLDVASIGDGWCFEALRRSLEESILVGEPPWAGFEELGRRWNVPALTELASALSLAGASGARVTETLRARAQSGRDRQLAEVRSEAERKSESMGIPVAAMLLGWILFLGYPAIANLVGS